ncbi:signal peptidase I [Lachnobacterium bovis]|uniref:Signal peptidase I n=1 Tax=Lachnobacterium bovis TaxID=140626 RepID=A0A1H9TG31_9FIRM|nr:signal peptidase I [Lachnobacterium bovis]SER95779.1 signal peptidase, endoplasmic reticulum-type [Lachnobacterium bovis]
MIKKICSFLATLLMLGLLVVAGLLFIPKALGYEEFAVLSGSMRPKLEVGTLVYTKEEKMENLKEGDIISFRIAEDTVVTHRINKVNDDGTFITKGDANNIADGSKVMKQNIIGKYAFHVPYLGYVSIYTRTPMGIAALCGLVVVILLLNFLPDAIGSRDVYSDDRHNEE